MKTFLIKLDRICAWSLVAAIVAYFITGYGQTKGIISPALAKFIHDSIMPIPSIIAFAVHSAFGFHVALKRWRVWGRPWSIALSTYAILLIVGVLVMQFVVKTGSAAPVIPQTIAL